jgi:hypothetical protein
MNSYKDVVQDSVMDKLSISLLALNQRTAISK